MTDTTPEAVERWNVYPYDQYSTDERTSITGEWVRYEDYAAVCAALEAERVSHTATLKDAQDECARAEAAKAEVARLREALTPSGDTKADYIGEIIDPITGKSISWTAIKMVMKMIAARAALDAISNND
jgi:hypothetical protein